MDGLMMMHGSDRSLSSPSNNLKKYRYDRKLLFIISFLLTTTASTSHDFSTGVQNITSLWNEPSKDREK